MTSFLNAFEPRRRHLTFLAGLLVLVFVLSVLVAFRAQRAEVARQAQAEGVLQDLAANAATLWGGLLEQRMAESLKQAFYGTIDELVGDAGAPLDLVVARAHVGNFCKLCDGPQEDAAFFSIDLSDGRIEYAGREWPLTPELRQAVEARVAAGEYALVHDLVGMSFQVIEIDGGYEALAVFVRRNNDERPVRIVGYRVPHATMTQLLELVFQLLPLLPRAITNDQPNDVFFSVRATAGSTAVLSTAAGNSFVAADTLRSAPFSKLVLQVGIRDGAATRLLMSGGESSGTVVAILLITITGLLVLALLLVRREAELTRLRADFVSGVTHELRTPLAQIRMFTETLLLGRVRSDVERRRSLEIIDQEAGRLWHLVENVLQFSKSEGGRGTHLKPEPIDLAAEVRLAVESFGPLCRAKNVDIRMELQENVTVPVDRFALRQIMVNLLDNAVKYGPTGQRITVGAVLVGDGARLWVDDEGPGIPAADRLRVFDAFFLLEREDSVGSTGSGIGLAVVQELVRLHHGVAIAEGAPGGGARIVVHLPGAYLPTVTAAGFAAAS